MCPSPSIVLVVIEPYAIDVYDIDNWYYCTTCALSCMPFNVDGLSKLKETVDALLERM